MAERQFYYPLRQLVFSIVMIDRAYMLHDVERPKNDVYICRGCSYIYRSKKKNPQCPREQQRCIGTIQRATARHVG